MDSSVADEDQDLEEEEDVMDQPAWDIGFDGLQGQEEELSERSFE